MGRIWMSGGASTDLDPVNAESWQILQNRVIVDKNGNPLTGTMPDRAAVNPIINAGERFPIPEGYHNGLGGVTANSLAAQTPGNALAAHILSPYVAWSNGVRIPGNIATMGAQTISPTSYQQIVQTSGKYLSGNVAVNGVTNLRPENVKKGVQVGDIVGTAEGYFPTANDLYLRGNNINGFTIISSNYVKFESGGISLHTPQPTSYSWNYLNLRSGSNINYSPYSYLNIEGYFEQMRWFANQMINLSFVVSIRKFGETVDLAVGNNSMPSNNSYFTVRVPVGPLASTVDTRINLGINGDYWYTGDDGDQWERFTNNGWNGWVYRIWMS